MEATGKYVAMLRRNPIAAGTDVPSHHLQGDATGIVKTGGSFQNHGYTRILLSDGDNDPD